MIANDTRSLLPFTSEQRPALERLHRAVYLLAAAQRGLVIQLERAGAVSPERLRVLVVLMVLGEATPSQLARQAGLKPNTITTIINQLERNGVVLRRRDDADRRVWWVSLTEQGRAEVTANQDRWNRRFATAFADTPDEDLDAACRVLEVLAREFQGLTTPEPETRS